MGAGAKTGARRYSNRLHYLKRFVGFVNFIKKWSAMSDSHRVIILNRGNMFAFQWREFSPPLSSAHRLLQCYHSQWEIGDAAIPGESPSAPRHYRAISQWASSLDWRHAVMLHILFGKICTSFFLFYCEGMLSLDSVVTVIQKMLKITCQIY